MWCLRAEPEFFPSSNLKNCKEDEYWSKLSLRFGRQTIPDLPRPDQANIVITNDSIAAVDDMIRANRRVRTRDISDELNLSKGTVHQHLQYSKVCAEWVPKHLTIDHQKQRMGLSLQHLICYEEDPAFWNAALRLTSPGVTTTHPNPRK
ncbi:hypothetical protein AVEN_185985-1 [Araneus ventricosus]|uniref:Histone-lysine N-methyltransferase SETMAR n=1 Tax=Araneus ventricosus TaxID=182803 RepID=A0A4Y2K937_ARAVE|nr:hypothetical protein AVEN_185985-1 [Araneus ventricosus]